MPELGRKSRSKIVCCRRPRTVNASSVVERLGSRESPVPVAQKMPAARIASASRLPGLEHEVGRDRLPVEKGKVVGRMDLAEGERSQLRACRPGGVDSRSA